jgi:hypothetical protein
MADQLINDLSAASKLGMALCHTALDRIKSLERQIRYAGSAGGSAQYNAQFFRRGGRHGQASVIEAEATIWVDHNELKVIYERLSA